MESTSRSNRAVYVELYLFSFLQGLANGIWGFLSIFLLNIGGSALDVGVLGTVPGLASTFMQLAWGRISNRFGRSWQMVYTGFLLTSLFSIPVILSLKPWQVILASGLQVFLGSIAGVAVTVSLASALSPESRASFMGVYNPVGFAGNMVGNVLAGLLIPVIGYRQTLFGYTLINLAIALLVRFGLRGSDEAGFNYLRLFASSFRELWRGLRELPGVMRRGGVYTRWCLGMAIRGFGFAMFGPISTVYLVQALMATEPQIGGLNSLAFAIRIMASPVLGWIAAKKGVKRIMLLGFSLGFLYPLVFTIAEDVSHLVPVYVLSGFFWSCINASWFAWQMELIPRERGVYAGLLSFINGMAWALGPFLGGLLGDVIGLQLSAIISSAAVLAGLLILSKVPERLEVAPAQP